MVVVHLAHYGAHRGLQYYILHGLLELLFENSAESTLFVLR